MGVTTAGANHVLNTVFNSGTPVTTWYIGLINNTPTPSLAAADTLASHAGWAELVAGTDYTGNRLAWTNGAASSGSMTNASTVDFPMLTTKTVYGLFLASAATGTSGTLYGTAALSGGTQAVNSGDTLQITVTDTAS